MKIKVSDATPAQLDVMVAKANGWITYPTDSIEEGRVYHQDKKLAPFGPKLQCCYFSPSTYWKDGGPIIEHEKLSVVWEVSCWCATIEDIDCNHFQSSGNTPLIAAMRCYVISKLGDYVDISDFIIDPHKYISLSHNIIMMDNNLL